MQLRVELHVAPGVGLAEALGHGRQDVAKIGQVTAGRPSRGAAREQSLQRVAHLLDLERFSRRDQPDAGSPVRLADDEALLVKHGEGGADCCPPRPIANGKIRLHQALVGLELATHDRLAEPVARTGRGARGCSWRVGGGG